MIKIVYTSDKKASSASKEAKSSHDGDMDRPVQRSHREARSRKPRRK